MAAATITASARASEASLEAVMGEVYRIIHLQDPNYVISGEPIHADAPEITRCMINVDAVYFNIYLSIGAFSVVCTVNEPIRTY
jgi:hypothetical protein